MDNVISEDTPNDNVEELKWKIDRLIEQVHVHAEDLKREREQTHRLQNKIADLEDRFDRLTGRLTVKALRDAGLSVEITVPEPWDDCGCCD